MGAARSGPSIRGDYLIPREDDNTTSFIYPHLQVKIEIISQIKLILRILQVNGIGLLPKTSKFSFASKRHLLINDVSFEIRGGEIMVIMATSENEGTALLNTIAGKESPVVGDILLNGQHVRARHLKNRVAYVQSDAHLCKDMTVIQTLRFHYDLKKPTSKLQHLKIDAMDRVI